MREDAFRGFLFACGYTANSVASRLTRCRSVERRLAADLDELDLSAPAVTALHAKLASPDRTRAIVANELNAVRTYRRFRSGDAPGAVRPEWQLADAASIEAPAHPLLADRSTADIMQLYGAILQELRRRGVSRTENSPVGDYAEYLFAKTFGWHLQGNSAQGFDAVDDAGHRYQIKARRLVTPRTSRQLSAIRQIERHSFDTLAAVLFDADMIVRRAVLIPSTIVTAEARYVGLTNSQRVMLSDRLLDAPSVVDVTDRLRANAASLP